MRRPDSLFNHLQFWANYMPRKTGLIGPNSRLSFRQYSNLVKKTVVYLKELGVRPGQVFYQNLSPMHSAVVFPALHYIGVRVAANFGGYDPSLPLKADGWITSTLPENTFGLNHILVDAPWWKAVDDKDLSQAGQPYSWDDDEICYLNYTSGTTGSNKCVGMTLAQIYEMDALTASPWDRSGKILNLLGLPFYSTNLFRLGLVVIAGNELSDLGKLFLQERPNTLLGSPSIFSGFIDQISSQNASFDFVRQVVSLGGQVSPVVYEKLRSTFPNAAILNMYGSTEGGWIASMRLTSPDQGAIAGAVLPEVQLQIVDEEGVELPQGEVGIVRYKSIVTNYVNDADATSEAFKDGWFYPGDTGAINKDGHLVLAGRTNEVLNVGGRKIDPVKIDEFVMTLPGVIDCGTFAIETSGGNSGTGVALVADQTFDKAEAHTAILGAFPEVKPLVLVETEEIPKTQMGKTKRKLLTIQFAEVHRNAKESSGS